VSLHLRASQREWALIGSNRELSFLSDIGRGLLRALEPDQLVRRVAGATFEATNASLCAVYAAIAQDTNAACVFDREGSAEDSTHLNVERLQNWLTSAESINCRPTYDKRGVLNQRRSTYRRVRRAFTLWRTH
jgi:hypothetical protein